MGINYLPTESLSYADYLKLEAQKKVTKNLNNIEYGISRGTREIIASNEQLARQNIHAVEASTDRIVQELSSVRGTIEELNATFQWGFTEVLIGIGHLNDTLNDLIRIAKTPAQTWAYNQFEIARDAYNKELYPEALECLERAINGLGDNPGYKLEYRFHYLQGLVRLGSMKNYDPEILDLPKAENAFLNAARYAKQEYPKEAARAFLSAGWAAYCQRKLGDARNYTRQSFTLNPELSEAFFQAAKIEMHLKEPDYALPFLQKSVEIDRNYTLKALADDDFKQYKSRVIWLFDILTKETQSRAKHAVKLAQTAFNELQNWHIELEDWHVKDDSAAKKAKYKLDEAEKNLKSNTYYGALDAEAFAKEAVKYSREAVAIKRDYLINEVNNLFNQSEQLITSNHSLVSEYASKELTIAEKSLASASGLQSNSYDEILRKIHDLESAQIAVKEALEIAKQRVKSREISVATTGGIIGFIIGFFVGFIVTFIGGFFPLLILSIIAQTNRGTSVENTVEAIIVLALLIGGIVGGIGGAKGGVEKFSSWFRKK